MKPRTIYILTKAEALKLVALGYMIHLGLDMFHQDLLGLEGYIALVREGWVNLHPIVGLLVIVVAFIGLLPRLRKSSITFVVRKESRHE